MRIAEVFEGVGESGFGGDEVESLRGVWWVSIIILLIIIIFRIIMAIHDLTVRMTVLISSMSVLRSTMRRPEP